MNRADTISRRIDRAIDLLSRRRVPRHWVLCLYDGEAVPGWIERNIDHAADEVVIRRIPTNPTDECYIERISPWSYGYVTSLDQTYLLWGDGSVSRAGGH